MFGHSCEIAMGDQKWTLVEHQETDFLKKQGRIKEGYYWFRAPKITLDQLSTTAENLAHLEGKFQFDVWATFKEQGAEATFDSSLKILDQMDAATFAWGHTEIWMKWNQEQENDLKKAWKSIAKPKAVKVTKNGTIRVTIEQSSLSD
jgi:hypothetical protein